MKKPAVLLGLGLALLLTGCSSLLPQSREMEDMALMRTMGIDLGEEGGLRVTVSSGPRARGIQGEEEPPLILTAQRPTISGATLAMQALSDSYVFYGHVDQLLLGERLARQGILDALEHFQRDQELGLGAEVWLIQGSDARQAIEAGKERGVDRRLSSLQADGEMGTAGISRTAGEVLTDLLEDGAAFLPALAQAGEEGEDTVLLERGYGILREDRLVGFLEGEYARGLELCWGQPGAELLVLEGKSLHITDSSLRCVPLMDGEGLCGLCLELKLSARGMGEELSLGERERLAEQAGRICAESVEKTVKQLQLWNADCLELSRRAAGQSGRWGEIREQWGERFPRLVLQTRCSISLN